MSKISQYSRQRGVIFVFLAAVLYSIGGLCIKVIPWNGMSINGAEMCHPTFLYESLWNAAGFIALHFLSKKRQYDGQIALGYAAWYGLGRTFIEGLRTDSLYWGNFRVSQLLAAVTCVAAAIVLIVQMFRSHDKANLFVNQVAAKEAEQEKAEG